MGPRSGSYAPSNEGLSTLLRRIKEERTAGNVALYRQGKLISEIFQKGLWRERYQSWLQFAVWLGSELGVSRQTIWLRMLVADNATEDQVAKYGHTQMQLYLQSPDEDRIEILQALESKRGRMSALQVRDLKDALRARRGEATGCGRYVLNGAGAMIEVQFSKKEYRNRVKRFLSENSREGEPAGDALLRLLFAR